MRQDNMQQALIDSAIHVVAEQGIHKTTTKALATSSGVNEAYIYRLFGGKEDLLKQAFAYLDRELVSFWLEQSLPYTQPPEDAGPNGTRMVLSFWRYVLGDREKCLFFISYYYSHYYQADYSPKDRRALYEPVIQRLRPYFSEGVDVWEEINHLYDVTFPLASRVLRGEIQNSETLENSLCARLFASVKPLLATQAPITYNKEEG